MKVNKVNRSAKIGAKGVIIAAIITASAYIIVATIGLFNAKNPPGVVKPPETVTPPDTVVIPWKSPVYEDEKVSVKEYKEQLKAIENLINHSQYPTAYRAYRKLYDSMPLSLKSKISKQNIETAKKRYDLGRWQEAALMMKKNMENIQNSN